MRHSGVRCPWTGWPMGVASLLPPPLQTFATLLRPPAPSDGVMRLYT